ncbi:hypothetical protein CIG75_17830 [Tumebacillus algifaecis]|uniref:Peptidase C39-like domain-containing protein n=1 Tax=Tumebacillus algifaecis TaxID=1214604 RepID=A0A223D533_9BACL|nr:C39 family peptidase [Tumebacillus algifaecis]ASS76645.1 hypothetical protein CIG75_17830 [Tumebacillus algifaecis]
MKKLVTVSLVMMVLPVMLVSQASANGLTNDSKGMPLVKSSDKNDEKNREKMKLAKMHQEVRGGITSAEAVENEYRKFKAKWGGELTDSPEELRLSSAGNGKVEPDALYSKLLSLSQIPQERNWYCGPASVVEILKSYGTSTGKQQTQDSVVPSLYATSSTGTPWSKGTVAGTYFYPVADTLDYYMNSANNYAAYASPSAAQFKSSVVYTIDKGYPVVANVIEYSGNTTRLTGHPLGITLQHWVAVFGYNQNGDTAWYADSAAGAAGLSFDTSAIPKYSELPVSKWSTLVNERGIIW